MSTSGVLGVVPGLPRQSSDGLLEAVGPSVSIRGSHADPGVRGELVIRRRNLHRTPNRRSVSPLNYMEAAHNNDREWASRLLDPLEHAGYSTLSPSRLRPASDRYRSQSRIWLRALPGGGLDPKSVQKRKKKQNE